MLVSEALNRTRRVETGDLLLLAIPASTFCMWAKATNDGESGQASVSLGESPGEDKAEAILTGFMTTNVERSFCANLPAERLGFETRVSLICETSNAMTAAE